MALILGTWIPSTLDGEKKVSANGVSFWVPVESQVKVVTGSKGVEFVHVKVAREVYVFSALGMLRETIEARRSRALPFNWRAVVAS